MASRLGQFIKDTKNIEICIYYGFKKDDKGQERLVVMSKEDYDKSVADNSGSVECLKTVWRNYSWRIRNTILQSSIVYNPQTGGEEVDQIKYQDNVVKTCLVEWNLTDHNDEVIAISSEAIDELPDQIVRQLIGKYNEKSNIITEEEQKK